MISRGLRLWDYFIFTLSADKQKEELYRNAIHL